MGECDLCSLADGGVRRHAPGEGLEGVAVGRDGLGTKPMVEQLLADRTLGAIDRGEHGVEVEIVPRAIVQRAVPGCRVDTGVMVLSDRREVSLARPRPAPLRADAPERLFAGGPRECGQDERQDDCGSGKENEIWDGGSLVQGRSGG